MIIKVKVKTFSKSSSVVKVNNIYLVSLKSKPIKNKANNELIDTLSDYFHIPKSSVNIIQGIKSKSKLVEIKADENR